MNKKPYIPSTTRHYFLGSLYREFNLITLRACHYYFCAAWLEVNFFSTKLVSKKFHGLQKTCRAESFSWHNFCNGITSSNLAKLKNPQVCLKKNDVISDVFLLFLSKNLKTHFFPHSFAVFSQFPKFIF